jgi:hypothetical protein
MPDPIRCFEAISLGGSRVALWLRLCLLAELFDVSLGLRRCLVDVLAELGDAFVVARWLYVDDEARLIRCAHNPPARESLIGGDEQENGYQQ